MKESQVQAKIIKYLEAKGYYVRKIITANKSGTPDLLCCSPDGRFLGIEVKAPKKLKQVSKLQEYNLKEIKDRNGIALLVDSVQMLKEKLDDDN